MVALLKAIAETIIEWLLSSPVTSVAGQSFVSSDKRIITMHGNKNWKHQRQQDEKEFKQAEDEYEARGNIHLLAMLQEDKPFFRTRKREHRYG